MSTDSSSGHEEQYAAPSVSPDQFEKLAELIARSQQGYRALIDSLDQALFTLSLKGEVRVANLRLAEILGVAFPDLIGHPLTEFIESPTIADVQKSLPAFLKFGTWSGKIPVRLKADKEIRHFECWLQAVAENGEISAVTGWARDVTREHEAELRFSELFESLSEGIIFSTPDGKILDANPALVRMLGYESKQELRSHPAPDIYPNADERAALIHDLEVKGSVHNRPLTLRRKNGKLLHCFTSGFAIRDASGRPVRLQGIVVDITEKTEIERRLHREQELRRRMIANFPDLIIVLDREGRFTFVSDQVKQILGRTPAEYIGAQIGARANPEDRAKLHNMVQSIFSGEAARATLEFNAPHTDGTWRTLLATAGPVYDEDGKITAVVTSARDITETRKIERQLHKEQEFARKLVECFPHLIVVIDRDRRFTFVSERVRDVLGVPPEDYLGKRIGQRIDDENQRRILEMHDDIISGRKRQVQIEIQARHSDGSQRAIQIYASPLYDEKGEITGMVSSGQDVTESRRIEQQLVQKEKFASMGQMMVGAAHELNNPLTAILGVSDLLRERATDETMRRQVDLVLKQARRAAMIVQNLLAFSRPVTLGRSKLDLAEVIREVIAAEKSNLDQKKIAVAIEAPDDLPLVEGDRKLLKEVFSNVLANAEQAIAAGRDSGTIKISLGVSGAHVCATFTDNGVGIPPESIGKIFDPFFTTKRTGGSSGLGLTICLAVVKEHGGRIETESQPGLGATFRILLPMTADQGEASEAALAPGAKSVLAGADILRGHRAVIVDDEESISEIVQESLSARGMKVEAFGTSEAALKHLAANECDVIVCDFNLPGMSGEQFFERLRAQNPAKMPRFVFMTGDLLDAAAVERYQRAGASILQKPFHVAALAALLAELLKQQPAPVA
jgi:PAS domain S-box-containing protein